MTNNKKKLLSSIEGKTNKIPPIWLMRQAGRYLSEYRETRKQAGSFLDLCYNPELASKVTLQPIERFDFDAAIIFSDILVIPHAMGVSLDYIEGKGPVLSKVESGDDVKSLDIENITEKLDPVYQAISLTRKNLSDEKTLIGFTGAPWTIATYMIEGGGSKDFSSSKKFLNGHEKEFEELIDKLVKVISEHLINQIKAGSDVVQIFDSWAGVLSESDFDKWVIVPTKKIISKVKSEFPNTPIIGFPKGAGINYERFVKDTGVDAVGLDYTVPLKWAADNLQTHVPVQGNLDPYLLATDKEGMVKQVNNILDILGEGPFVFNLGHGILPFTPVENVELLLKTIRER